jgi:PAS fold
MICADRDGIIRLGNAGAEAIFGYRAEEAVGHTLDLIIPEHLRARHSAGYCQVMATGVPRYGREVLAVPALRKDGTRMSLAVPRVHHHPCVRCCKRPARSSRHHPRCDSTVAAREGPESALGYPRSPRERRIRPSRRGEEGG